MENLRRVWRWFSEMWDATADDAQPHPDRRLVDAHTRTFWSRGSTQPVTLVEADAPVTAPAGAKLRALVDRQRRGHAAVASGRPRANPAFAEGVFLELVRARQFKRAFTHLSPDCQRQWRSWREFAKAQDQRGLDHVRSMRVRGVRYPQQWSDPDGRHHRHVAELDVEYVLSNGRAQTTLPRTIHLVADGGQWRSLCYPDNN